MYKSLISAITAVSITASSLLCITANAEEQIMNNAVSGYISLSEGLKIAGTDKTPKIHIDKNDYSSVIRAANDLADDIKSVTSKTPVIDNDNLITVSSDGNNSIIIDENSMSVFVPEAIANDAQCYIAAYDKYGVLSAAAKSINATTNSTNDEKNTSFIFENSLTKPAGGKLKAFVWAKNMKSLTDVSSLYSSVDLKDVDIAIGTIGMSDTIDTLISNGRLNVREIRGKWESFTIQQIDNTIVIAGSDKRGTIYGIYDFCEKIGVSPWYWWSDADIVPAENLYVNLPDGGYTEGEPSVKYRGIFINDEYNMSQWSTALGNGKAMTHETYEKIFELLLRLKANYMWPAMRAYSPAFHNDEKNVQLADEYGIVMGSSYDEPLLRNNPGELDTFQDKWEKEHPDKVLYKSGKNETGKNVAYYWTDHDNSQNHVDNKEFLEAYWRESVKNNGEYENVYTLGMRGVHDGSFQTNMDIATALNEIIAVQRKIIQEEICDKTAQKIEDIPQVFIPYKDILAYYNLLEIPDDVTIMWIDDNYGYMRQNANDAERARSGRAGAYYHVSYYGWPTSYLWLSTTQPGLIREEMGKAYDMGADRMWVLNVGDLKPAENDIEYFLRLARDMNNTRETNISDIFASNAKRDFNLNDTDAQKYAEIMDEYYELSNSKRPEFIRSGEFSLTAYGDEAQRYLYRCKKLTDKTESLYNKLSETKKDAFFELALYPIRSFTNMMTDYIQTDRANFYTEQGRGNASYQFADEASAAATSIDADINTFNSLRNGKWNKIMNINPSELQSCDAHITTILEAKTPSELNNTSLAVSVDSQTSLDEKSELTLSIYDTYNKFIDIINQGYGSFEYTLTCGCDDYSGDILGWFNFSKTSGIVSGNDRIYVSLNKNAPIPKGTTNAYIQVLQKLGTDVVDTRYIPVKISNPNVKLDEKTYITSGGTVSIEAEHYSNSVSNGSYEWKIEKDFGRSGDSVKAYPDLSTNVSEPGLSNSAYLEYNVYFEEAGTYTLDVYRMPTLNERGSMQFAVGIDDAQPITLTGTRAYSGSQNKSDKWARGVLDNNEKLSASVSIPTSGLHKIRLYNISPGVVIDKMVLTTNVIKSYFGAPESYNTTYNTDIEAVPLYIEAISQADIKKTYE